MFEARQGKEIVVTVKNESGLLVELSKLLSEKGDSILAVSGTVAGGDCVVRLITDDILRTREALSAKGYSPEERSVVLLEVPHKPGMLRRVAEALSAEEIDLQHIYATASEQQEKCLLVLHTTNDEHVLPRLNKMQTV